MQFARKCARNDSHIRSLSWSILMKLPSPVSNSVAIAHDRILLEFTPVFGEKLILIFIYFVKCFFLCKNVLLRTIRIKIGIILLVVMSLCTTKTGRKMCRRPPFFALLSSDYGRQSG